MKSLLGLVACCVLIQSSVVHAAPSRLNLVIFSGQSNMVSFDPEADLFLPTVRAAFPDDEWISVKWAVSGKAIGNWVSNTDNSGNPVPTPRSYYKKIQEELVPAALTDATGNVRTPDTVTFVWMQGEADANEGSGASYEASLHSLMHLLQHDYTPDVNFILGRLSDYTGYNATPGNPYRWETVKQAQMDFTEDYARAVWVDTDDLNGSNDDLHYPTNQQPILGQRWAAEAINLLTVPEPTTSLLGVAFAAMMLRRTCRRCV